MLIGQLDAKNGNTLWADGISKEMKNIRVAFKILMDGKAAPIGHQFEQCHMVFDIKLMNLQERQYLVAGGHMTKALATIKYNIIVYRETVRIALMVAAINDLEARVTS